MLRLNSGERSGAHKQRVYSHPLVSVAFAYCGKLWQRSRASKETNLHIGLIDPNVIVQALYQVAMLLQLMAWFWSMRRNFTMRAIKETEQSLQAEPPCYVSKCLFPGYIWRCIMTVTWRASCKEELVGEGNLKYPSHPLMFPCKYNVKFWFDISAITQISRL